MNQYIREIRSKRNRQDDNEKTRKNEHTRDSKIKTRGDINTKKREYITYNEEEHATSYLSSSKEKAIMNEEDGRYDLGRGPACAET